MSTIYIVEGSSNTPRVRLGLFSSQLAAFERAVEFLREGLEKSPDEPDLYKVIITEEQVTDGIDLADTRLRRRQRGTVRGMVSNISAKVIQQKKELKEVMAAAEADYFGPPPEQNLHSIRDSKSS